MHLAQQLNFFNGENDSAGLWTKIIIATLIGIGLLVACLFAPARARRPIIASVTFVGGLYWVLYYFWPRPAFRDPVNDMPEGFVDTVGFYLADAAPIFGNLANILAAFILGLGVYSLVLIHFKRFLGGHKDRFFSLVLILAIASMGIFGYVDWYHREQDKEAKLLLMENWGFWQFGRDLLFDGLLQVLDGAMFSMIAFFILSAAYRAFRIRSVEATILLAAALIMMFSLMGALVVESDGIVDAMGGTDPASIWNNFRMSTIGNWIRNYLQTPGIRALDFGLGLGALALGLRLWLNLERQVGSA